VKISIIPQGFPELEARLTALEQRIKQPRPILLRMAAMVLDAAKAEIEVGGSPSWPPTKAPSNRHHILIKSGALLNSLSAANSESIRWQSENTVLAGTNLSYAGFIQKGTRWMPGRPYLAPTESKTDSALQAKMVAMVDAYIKAGDVSV
jgi:phage gpG-like protein